MKNKFNKFLDTLDTQDTHPLIESIKQGFNACFENQLPYKRPDYHHTETKVTGGDGNAKVEFEFVESVNKDILSSPLFKKYINEAMTTSKMPFEDITIEVKGNYSVDGNHVGEHYAGDRTNPPESPSYEVNDEEYENLSFRINDWDANNFPEEFIAPEKESPEYKYLYMLAESFIQDIWDEIQEKAAEYDDYRDYDPPDHY